MSIKSLFGYFNLIGENPKFTILKRKFGKEFEVYKGIGSMQIDKKFKTLDYLLDVLIENYQLLKNCKIDKVVIYINLAYQKVANWTVTPEQMNKLGFLNAVLCVSAYQAED